MDNRDKYNNSCPLWASVMKTLSSRHETELDVNYTKQSLSWEAQLINKFRACMEPEGSLPCSRHPATGPYPERDNTSSYNISLISILISFPNLHVGLQSRRSESKNAIKPENWLTHCLFWIGDYRNTEHNPENCRGFDSVKIFDLRISSSIIFNNMLALAKTYMTHKTTTRPLTFGVATPKQVAIYCAYESRIVTRHDAGKQTPRVTTRRRHKINFC